MAAYVPDETRKFHNPTDSWTCFRGGNRYPTAAGTLP